MISLALIYLFIFFICFCLGVLACLGLTKLGWMKLDNFEETSPDIFILVGLVTLTTFLGFCNILFPISGIIAMITFASIYVLVILNRRLFSNLLANYWNQCVSNKFQISLAILSFSPILVLLVLFTTNSLQSFDAGLYHLQYIQWIETFKTPPGLVWIHSRFAFNSHFHLVSAMFTFSSLQIKTESLHEIVFYPLNGFIFFMFTLRSIYKIISGLLSRDIFTPILYAVLLFCSFCIFGSKIQSPMPDIAVTIFIFYVFLIFLEDFRFSDHWSLYQVVLVLLIVILPTFKLSAGLLVLLLIPIVWRKPLLKLIPIGIIGVTIVIPYLIRNFLISGYIIYGLPQLDLFNPDWKFPLENVLTDNAVVKAWAIIPYKNYKEVLSLPFSQWFPVWWEYYGVELNRYVLTLTLVSPVIVLFVCWMKRRTFPVKLIILYVVLMINVAFWFISAPDPRFAWGFLYFNFALCFAALISIIKIPRIEYAVGMVILFLMYRSLTYAKADWEPIANKAFIAHSLWYPWQIQSAETAIFSEGTFELFVPVKPDGRCFNEIIPCTPYPLRRVRMRGGSLDDGFFYDQTIP